MLRLIKGHTFIPLIIVIFWGTVAEGKDFAPVASCFDKKDYKAGNQNWAVTQGEDGIMYFGNQGLLSFDGIIWETHMIAGNSTVRSVMADGDRIYAGSYEEFGYFQKDRTGRLVYTSLSSGLVDYKMQNDEIWNILKFNDLIIFQSFMSYFVYDGENVRPVRSPVLLMFLCQAYGRIFSDTNNGNLAEIDIAGGEFIPIAAPFHSPLIAILNSPDGRAYFVTYSDGIFTYDGERFSKFHTAVDWELSHWQVNKAALSQNGDIVVGTLLNGAVCVNSRGDKMWEINTSNVLQSNTVLGMNYDRAGNLWLALDGGIAIVPCDRSLMYVNTLEPAIGSVYTAYYSVPNLYLGTNQGLYRATVEDKWSGIGDIDIFPEVQGNVWHISSFGGQTFCGTNKSTYELDADGSLNVVCPVEGGMCMAYGRLAGREVLVQGTYTFLCIYVKRNGRWVYSHCVDGFLEPVSTIEIDYTGTIWAGHLHRGFYAIRLSNDLKSISSIETFSSPENSLVRVYIVNGRVVFADGSSFYTYDDIDKSLIKYEELNSVLGSSANAYKVCSAGYGLYWFINSSEAVLIDFSNGGATLRDVVSYELFDSPTVDMEQNVVHISNDMDLFTLNNSLAVYSYGGNNVDDTVGCGLSLGEVRITDAVTLRDSLLNVANEGRKRIPYKYRNVSFFVKCPKYNPVNDVRFSYFLDGRDRSWTALSSNPQVTFSYLPVASYTFRVRATTAHGAFLGELSYSFKICPPFYASLTAKIVYSLLIVLFAAFIVLFVRNILRRKIIEKELSGKSRDLASTAMSLIRKDEILMKIKDEVNAIRQNHAGLWADCSRIVNLIDGHLNSDEEWETFKRNFDQVNDDFFKNLHQRYPELTPTDLKFCAYLRLNLSSKDIASLMNISVKGVEAARSRIRKKINVPPECSLSKFFIDFK